MFGGPMTYIKRGMGPRWAWLSVLFCLFGGLAAFGIGNMIQANAVAEGLEHFGVSRWVSGAPIIVSVGLVTLEGIQWIAQVATFCVPFVRGLYMLGAFLIIVVYARQIPIALGMVFHYAFSPMAGVGSLLGTTIRYGLARGLWLPFALIGAVGGLRLIGGIADTLNGLMAFPNLIALIALPGVRHG